MTVIMPATPNLTAQQKTFTVIGSLLALLLAALDSTIVSSAGPVIQQKLEIGSSFYTLITTAYLVGEVVTLPIYGKLSDLRGRRWVLVVGIILFLIGSVLCGLSNSGLTLIVSRLIQGLGAGALINTAFAVVADIFPPSERGKYQGIFGSTFGLSSVIGPLLGGWLTDQFGWHSIFFINLPVGLIALVFIVAKMPELRFGNPRGKIDVLGVLWLAVFTIPLLLALSFGSSNPTAGELSFAWLSPEILGLIGLSIAGLIAFILTELRVAEPILELRLFRDPTFAVANLGSFVFGGVFLGAIIFLPVFMVNVVGLSATSAGLTILPLSFGITVGNIASGGLASRFRGVKGVLLAGGFLTVIGYLLLGTTLTPQSSNLELTWKMILLGIGFGPAIPLFTLAVQSAVEPSRIGEATGANGFFRQLGLTIGLAVLGTVFANGITRELQPRVDVATASLPASLKSQFSSAGPTVGGEGVSSEKFDAEKIKETIAKSLEDQKLVVTAAIRDGDSGAIAKLLADEDTPDETKENFAKGSIQTQIAQEFATQRELTIKAIRDGDAKAIQALLRDKNTPNDVKERLAKGSIQTQIKTAFAEQRERTTRAIRDGDPKAIQALLADKDTPADIKTKFKDGSIQNQIARAFVTQRDLTTRAIRDGDAGAIKALLEAANSPADVKARFAQGSIQAQIARAFVVQRDRTTRAIRDGDAGAIRALNNDPNTPDDVKARFKAGSIQTQIARGFQVQRDLVTQAIRDGDARAIRTLLADQNTPAETKARFAAGSIQSQIARGFQAQRDLVTRAIRDGDEAAIKGLLADPRTPAQIKAQFKNGSIQTQIARGFEAQAQAVTGVISSGDPQAWQGLLNDERLPKPFRDGLKQIPPQALETPEGRAGVIQQVTAQLETARQTATTQAVNAALAGALQGSAQGQLAATDTSVSAALKGALSGLEVGERAAIKSATTSALKAALAGLETGERTARSTAVSAALKAALAGLETGERTATQTATREALKGALDGLETGQATALKAAPAKALKAALEGLRTAQVTATKEATSSALKGALDGLNEARETAFTTVDKVGVALKDGFTLAITGMFRIAVLISLLGCLVTVFLPKVALRDGDQAGFH
jgi:EmrB/QacA subfamily drug resistance transporter